MKKVLAISKGILHPTVFSRRCLKKILISATQVTVLENASQIDRLDGLDIGTYQAVVLFFHEKQISDNELNKLKGFIMDGGGLFCIHGALASFKGNTEYEKITGARFTGHDAIMDMHIKGDAEFTLRDELYKFELQEDCDIRLSCNKTPVFWTRKVGKGKVACLSPGHKAATFRNPGIIKIITQTLDDLLKISGGTDEEG